MADAALEFLLDNLKQLLQYHGNLIAGAKDELVNLEEELRMLKAFLVDTTKLRRRNDRIRESVRQIRDLVYDAEDFIDSVVTLASEPKSRNYFSNWKPINLHNLAVGVQTLRSKVKTILGDKTRFDFALISIPELPGPDDDNEAPIVRQANIVGFGDEEKKLIGYLKEEKDQLDVISIIGMPGLGKTTLAGMIFRNADIQYEFPTRIWIYISQEFKRKNVLLAILKEVTTVSDEMTSKSDADLAAIVAKHLSTGKFLIVMDDVWTAEDWNNLKLALPMSNNMGKILITSRQEEVGNAANPRRTPHQLRFLTPEESWLLLRWEVFGKPDDCPPELKDFGERILDKCAGLPLAIVVIGGILSKKVSATGDMSAVKSTWKKVSDNVNTHIVAEDPTRRMEKIIALSYDKLPYHLKACFLYLGIFPEDFEIPAWKLTRMWIAEGFIQHKEQVSLEESAENYLDDLINRNLLRVHMRRRSGKVKACRIHDMIRDFCITEAGNERENFLQEIKKSREGSAFTPPVNEIKRCRRICVHSNAAEFFALKPYGPGVRSFVYFSDEEIDLPVESNSAIPAAFKLLRVLEVQPIRFTKNPKDIHQLVHLRFISISLNLEVLPLAFSKLWNIQTLIVNTKHRTLEIKADIWKMKQLRHFKTNSSATLPKTERVSTLEAGENIKSLGTISPQSCTEGVFARARYVKKLGVRGRLATLVEARNGSFENMGKLRLLEKLKLINDVFPGSASENPLPSLPPAYQFPPKLRRLTLADTFLDWNKMSVLGLLENLEVLKLKDKAFMGKQWKAADGGFRMLEVLYIGRTNLVDWEASKHHFPRLRILELLYCEDLKKIPEQLAEIPSFQMLKLHRCQSAATSVEKFRNKEEMQKDQSIKFELSIFPPLEHEKV